MWASTISGQLILSPRKNREPGNQARGIRHPGTFTSKLESFGHKSTPSDSPRIGAFIVNVSSFIETSQLCRSGSRRHNFGQNERRH